MKGKDFNYSSAFGRNIGLVTVQEQEILKNAKVGIPGMGGVGGITLMTLARMGIGNFHITDIDSFDIVNFNRQYGASMGTWGKKKADTMRSLALSVNPKVKIKNFKKKIDKTTVDNFLEGVDIVIDGLDFFAIDARRLLFNKAREKGIPVITAGPIGFSSAMLIFTKEGMSFDEYFDIHDNTSRKEKLVNFAIGLAPAMTHFTYMDPKRVSLDKGKGPSMGAATDLCAGMSSIEALKILLGRKKPKPAPHYFQFDAYRQMYKKGYLWRGNKNPIQMIKRYFAKKKFNIQ